MHFDAGKGEGGNLFRRCKIIIAVLAGKSEDHMGGDFDSACIEPSYRILHGGETVSPVDLFQRGVIGALDTELNPDLVSVFQGCEIFHTFFTQAVRACRDDHDFIVRGGQRLLIKALQCLNIRIGVGERLEIGEIGGFRSVTFFDITDAALRLFRYAHVRGQVACGGTVFRTESASAGTVRFPVRTGQSQIERNPLERLSVMFRQVVSEKIEMLHEGFSEPAAASGRCADARLPPELRLRHGRPQFPQPACWLRRGQSA